MLCAVSATQSCFTMTPNCVKLAALACAPGGRETAASSGLYKYRTAVQANLYANGLLRLSLVPPCLRTGANFGCTAFFSSVLRNYEMGKLGSVIYRQTDGGSDNDA
eukprot:5098848-Pleurochrysis_carterae.AAC.1